MARIGGGRHPPKGGYLADLARGQAELDSFYFIEDLKIARGPLLSVLTGTSLHGALPDAWILERPSAKATLEALTERWQVQGLPTYAQFDTIFQGAHQFANAIGRVSRLCLALIGATARSSIISRHKSSFSATC